MKREKITISDHGNEMLGALARGVYLTTKVGEKINTMVIGWGNIGIIWGKPVFICYVRKSRFTKEMLDSCREFTVNMPTGPYDRSIFELCGSKSGRDMDKIAEAGLTPVEGSAVNVPAIAEFPMTLECRVLYRQEQDVDKIPAAIRDAYYPDTGSGPDGHIAYIGEIVDSYILR